MSGPLDDTTSLRSHANTRASTLRPRNARLVSFLENDGLGPDPDPDVVGTGQATATSISTATGSASVTAKRTSVAAGARTTLGSTRAGRSSEEARRQVEDGELPRRGSGTTGLWDSWTQIQGIASTLLGNEGAGTGAQAIARPGSPVTTPVRTKPGRGRGAIKSAQKWGPQAQDHIGVGSGAGAIEERQAMLQAKKRESLLRSAVDQRSDSSGRFKRKDSSGSLTARSPSHTEDALVYRHKVAPSDTMAGVAIKYSCQPEAFRKVNRLWPNDKIQIRDVVFLPVEACAVRGRKVDGPDSLDLLEDGVASRTRAGQEQDPACISTASSSESLETEDDFKHDSWVVLPNLPGAVEILRISRTKTGYFPSARRKPNHSLLSPELESTTASARTSFDTLRHPPSHAAQQAQLQQQQHTSTKGHNSESSPHRLARAPTSSSTLSRHRAYSSATTSSQHTNTNTSAHSNAFWSALRGPGGVGSLRGPGTESSRPGPANDSLNQNFAKYLPSLAITNAQGQSFDEDSGSDNLKPYVAARTLSHHSLGLPRASMDSLRSSRSGRSNSSASAFGSGVENWVKKLASATAHAATGTRATLSRTNSDRTIGPSSGIGGETGLGDLIELEMSSKGQSISGSDIEPDAAESDHERGRQQMSQVNDEGREEEDLLNRRFPMRGKVSSAYTSKQ